MKNHHNFTLLIGFDGLFFLLSVEQVFCDCETWWDHCERACTYTCFAFKTVHSTDMEIGGSNKSWSELCPQQITVV